MLRLALCLLCAARVQANAAPTSINVPVQTAQEAYDALESSKEPNIALVFTGAVDRCGFADAGLQPIQRSRR